MRIIGCDLHAAQQTIAMLDRENGEITERTLAHDGHVYGLNPTLSQSLAVGYMTPFAIT